MAHAPDAMITGEFSQPNSDTQKKFLTVPTKVPTCSVDRLFFHPELEGEFELKFKFNSILNPNSSRPAGRTRNIPSVSKPGTTR
jgi:hypothetical protein